MAEQSNSRSGYDVVAKLFHWLIFLLLAAQYAVGSIMPHIGRKTLDEGWVSWHFSIGAAILLVIVLRLGWRLLHPVPLLATMAPWSRCSPRVTHWTLYALVFAMTMLGWAAANSRGWDVKLLGVVPLPATGAQGLGLGRMRRATSTISWSMCFWASSSCTSWARFITIFVLRDRVMQRMLSFSRYRMRASFFAFIVIWLLPAAEAEAGSVNLKPLTPMEKNIESRRHGGRHRPAADRGRHLLTQA